MLDNITGLYDKSRTQFKAFFSEMVRVGILDWPKNRIDYLTVSAVILIRFGLEYLREKQQAFDSSAVEQTSLQHLTLFEHQLDPGAAKRLRDAAANRLPDSEVRAS